MRYLRGMGDVRNVVATPRFPLSCKFFIMHFRKQKIQESIPSVTLQTHCLSFVSEEYPLNSNYLLGVAPYRKWVELFWPDRRTHYSDASPYRIHCLIAPVKRLLHLLAGRRTGSRSTNRIQKPFDGQLRTITDVLLIEALSRSLQNGAKTR